MADPEMVKLLRTDVAVWNQFRQNTRQGPGTEGPDLRGADLRDVVLRGADLSRAELAGANLTEANLYGASLQGAHLAGAMLIDANLHTADLSRADMLGVQMVRTNLRGANLGDAFMGSANFMGASMIWANLVNADLRYANLSYANLTHANLAGAKLSGSTIYAINAWDVEGEPADQDDLVITPYDAGKVTVGNFRLAQFMYLMMSNTELRGVINTITSKVVLILGRFSEERKPVLDAIRNALRRYDCVPVVFDFAEPISRGFGETVALLAGMAKYVIADITDATEVRSELSRIVPRLTSVPVAPILRSEAEAYATFRTDVQPYPWVLPIYEYDSTEQLIEAIDSAVVEPATRKWRELVAARQ